MRYIRIKKQGWMEKEGKLFEINMENIENTENSQEIECAFDKDRSCNINCAACEKAGKTLYCNRQGKDNEFIIGTVDE